MTTSLSSVVLLWKVINKIEYDALDNYLLWSAFNCRWFFFLYSIHISPFRADDLACSLVCMVCLCASHFRWSNQNTLWIATWHLTPYYKCYEQKWRKSVCNTCDHVPFFPLPPNFLWVVFLVWLSNVKARSVLMKSWQYVYRTSFFGTEILVNICWKQNRDERYKSCKWKQMIPLLFFFLYHDLNVRIQSNINHLFGMWKKEILDKNTHRCTNDDENTIGMRRKMQNESEAKITHKLCRKWCASSSSS